MRSLSPKEEGNEKIIAQTIGQYALLHATRTGLEKCTFDATESIRTLFRKAGFHDYNSQGRGRADCGVEKPAVFIYENLCQESTVSLYKPKAKPRQGGDPRFWLRGAKEFLLPDEIVAIFIHNRKCCLINLSREKLRDPKATEKPPLFIDKFLQECEESLLGLANELIVKLRDLAKKGPLIAPPHDRGVGYAVEKALGLKINSRGIPDYKGKIEIKAGRENSKTTLFSLAPNWELAKEKNILHSSYINRFCTSAKCILQRYGYYRWGRWNLQCDVTTRNFNSQGLRLYLDQKEGTLTESCRQQPNQVAIWSLDSVYKSFENKHPETMFIKARRQKKSSKEIAFFLEKATYVRTPCLSKFSDLLSCGIIQLGHRQSSTHDHGTCFKISPKKVSQLFLSHPRIFSLEPD